MLAEVRGCCLDLTAPFCCLSYLAALPCHCQAVSSLVILSFLVLSVLCSFWKKKGVKKKVSIFIYSFSPWLLFLLVSSVGRPRTHSSLKMGDVFLLSWEGILKMVCVSEEWMFSFPSKVYTIGRLFVDYFPLHLPPHWFGAMWPISDKFGATGGRERVAKNQYTGKQTSLVLAAHGIRFLKLLL